MKPGRVSAELRRADTPAGYPTRCRREPAIRPMRAGLGWRVPIHLHQLV